MIKIDKNTLVANLVNFFKTLGLILLFVLSFPFSLLYWPLKSVVSKLSQTAPPVLHASVPAVAIPAGQSGPELAPHMVSPTESLESSTPDQSVESTGPDADKKDPAIKLGNSK